MDTDYSPLTHASKRTPMERFAIVSSFIVIVICLAGFSVGSWYGIEYLLTAFDGECFGPVCIGGP